MHMGDDFSAKKRKFIDTDVSACPNMFALVTSDFMHIELLYQIVSGQRLV